MAEAGSHPDNAPLPAGGRVACRIEYDGGAYCGWQAQHGQAGSTVQETLEQALGAVAAAPIRVHCAGRTDTGVHAFCQVIHFDGAPTRSPRNWVLGTNANLPPDIRVHWAVGVGDEFHARFSALSRSYRYLIANTPVRPAIATGQLSWYRPALDEARMQRAAGALLGERDFSAFRAASCQSRTPMREVMSVRVSRRGALVMIDIRANAFLHHMVRNIAGSLMAVGSGRQPESWIATLLAGRDRTLAADTAPPEGLYLVDVEYPPSFGLPATPEGPVTLGM